MAVRPAAGGLSFAPPRRPARETATPGTPAEGQRVVEEAAARFAIAGVHCVHRTGDLAIGDLAVWVGVGAAHRGAAFDACRFVIDEVKSRVAIWKHERYADGDVQWLHPDTTVAGASNGREEDR